MGEDREFISPEMKVWLSDNKTVEANFWIETVAFVPFSILLIAFCILLCFRRIEDYYLRRSLGFLIASMSLRVAMFVIILMVLVIGEEKQQNFILVELKLQVFQFILPHYFFLMVITSLLFSVHSFYTSLRSVLFPQLRADDDEYRSVSLNRIYYVSTKRRFMILNSFIFLLLTIFTTLILL